MSTPKLDINDTEAVTRVIQEAAADAVEEHRRMKRPVVVVIDGEIVWLRPEDIAPRALPGDDEPLPAGVRAAQVLEDS
jgi:hypothetical protein